MRLQQITMGRPKLLQILGVSEASWSQMGLRNEQTMAFGLERPGLYNHYGELDLFSQTLTMLASGALKIDRPRVAKLIRGHWREQLAGLAQAERTKEPVLCFVIGVTPDNRKMLFAVGPCESEVDKMSKRGLVPFAIQINFVCARLRLAAKKAKVRLPRRLVPYDPDSETYAIWMKSIEEYRRVAKARRRPPPAAINQESESTAA